MTILATAPVPAYCRLSTIPTDEYPLVTPTLVQLAELAGVSAWQAFTSGARIRTADDVFAVAQSAPPMTVEQEADLADWCAEVATWPLARVAETWGTSYATAVELRDLIAAGGAR